MKYLPNPPTNSVVVIGNAELWSFLKQYGLQIWYNDKTIQVYSLSDLNFEDGKPFIQSPVENLEQIYTGAKIKKIFLDPSRLFAYQIVRQKLIKIDLQEWEQSHINTDN